MSSKWSGQKHLWEVCYCKHLGIRWVPDSGMQLEINFSQLYQRYYQVRTLISCTLTEVPGERNCSLNCSYEMHLCDCYQQYIRRTRLRHDFIDDNSRNRHTYYKSKSLLIYMWSWRFPLTIASLHSWGQHGAYLGPTGPRWALMWAHGLCYLGMLLVTLLF